MYAYPYKIPFTLPLLDRLFQSFCNASLVFQLKPMASSSSSHQQNDQEQPHAFYGIEPPGKRRKVDESLRLYDVFINHRGPDVKDTLATDLYNSLHELGIRAFLDSKEKELGDSFPSTIETAICSASVHIVIFSKRYAESPWCLAELVLMLHSPAKIIPVFYDVQPWELRHIEKGVYVEAFTDYENKGRYPEKLKEWKETLQSVSFIAGEEFNGDCKNIVSAVRNEVERLKSKLHVAKYPVGLNKLVQDFEKQCLDELVDDFESHCRMREEGKNKSKIVGIFGMGGVGKTTLSKELFNRMRSQYSRLCFLFDVREACVRRELPSLQMSLVQKIFCENPSPFKSIEEGTSYIGECIERSNHSSFLIVLDDIDHVDQLDNLLIIDMLNKYVNSFVIVTTRDVGVLVSAGIITGYNLKGMDRDVARELFCWHAFQQSQPVSGYEDLVDDFLDGCGGLPLSLQVLGRHVHGRDENYWRLELEKVSKMLDRDIKKRLKISFDALDSEQQQIFMDIACFFIDEEKKIALKIWKRSGWTAQHALQTLKDKCLVEEIDIEDAWKGGPQEDGMEEDGLILRMHDHLRDLGREMANELSCPHRVWDPQDIESLELEGFQAILSKSNLRRFGSIKDTSMDADIRYFIGNSDNWDQASTSLLLLEIYFYNKEQIASIPSWIPLQNLQYLNISGGCLDKLWERDVKQLSSLKELVIEDTILQEFPDLCRMSNHLEKVLFNGVEIRIEWWSFLKSLTVELYCYEFPPSHVIFESSTSRVDLRLRFRGLVALKSPMSSLRKVVLVGQKFVTKVLISGYHYPKLQSLHLWSMENLSDVDLELVTALASLMLRDCNKLKSVSGISDLKNLVKLQIANCSQIEELAGLSQLSCLNTVSIEVCAKLNRLELEDCANLKTVKVIKLPKLVIFSNRHCPQLETIQIDKCQKLQNVSGISDLKNLVKLQIANCSQIEELAGLSHLSCLNIVSIENCGKLNRLELEDCANLKTVKVIILPKLVIFSFRDCPQLETIQIDRCQKLQNVSGISDLRNLVELEISECSEIEELAGLSHLSCLNTVSIEHCENLNRLELEDCANLKTVKVIILPKLVIFSFRDCPQLETIQIDRCQKLQNVSGISDLRNLVELEISECSEIEELAGLSHLSCLNTVSIEHCENLNRLELEDCANLKTVKVIILPKLVIFSFRHCPQLETIQIDRCQKLQNVSGISDLRNLVELEISECSEIEELAGLSHLSCLNTVSIEHCENLNRLELEDCANLKTVKVIILPKLVIFSFRHCPQLETIQIDRCQKLQNVSGISDLRNLVELEISECSEIEELAGLSHLSCLNTVSIEHCENLNRLELEDCANLKTVKVIILPKLVIFSFRHCPQLETIQIDRCQKLQNVSGISDLRNLVELEISECSEIEELAGLSHLSCLNTVSIEHSENLNRLELEDCANLKTVKVIILPKLVIFSFRDCPQLETIQIDRCQKLQNVSGISDLRNLVELEISECSEIEELAGLSHLSCLNTVSIEHCENLNRLELEDCANLKTVKVIILPKLVIFSFRHCPQLETIQIDRCQKLQNVSGISDLRNLVELEISECSEIEELAGLSHLSCLNTVSIEHCENLNRLELEDCANLKTVKVIILPKLVIFSFRHCPQLETIQIDRCQKLQNVSGISDLRNLVELEISECSEIEELAGLSHLSCLNTVSIEHCENLNRLELEDCANLKTVKVIILPKLVIFSFRHCPQLETIQIDRCQKLQNVSGISDLRNLVELEISECSEIEELAGLSHLSCLNTVSIEHCENLNRLELEDCANLKTVKVIILPKLVIFSFRHCPQLETIQIDRCQKLQNVSGISDLRNLVELEISECSEIEELAGLSHLSCLNTVSIEHCENLNHLELEDCANLKTVKVISLPKLVIFSNRHCPQLETIQIDKCQKLQNVAGIEELPALKRMEISQCSNEAIRNSIHKLQRVPWEHMMMANKCTAEGVESKVGAHLFSEWIAAEEVIPLEDVKVETMADHLLSGDAIVYHLLSCGAIIYCAVVAVLYVSPMECKKFIVVGSAAGEISFQIAIFPKFLTPIFKGLSGGSRVLETKIEKGYMVKVKKGEEWKTLPVMKIISDNLL